MPKPSDIRALPNRKKDAAKDSDRSLTKPKAVRQPTKKAPQPAKIPFVRKPHLSNRDLREHDGLKALRRQLSNDDKKGTN